MLPQPSLSLVRDMQLAWRRAEEWDVQSSSATERSRNNLVYDRIDTAKVAVARHIVMTTITRVSRFAGLTKLGTTPAGGFAAGPFKKADIWAWTCSGVGDVDGAAISVESESESCSLQVGR